LSKKSTTELPCLRSKLNACPDTLGNDVLSGGPSNNDQFRHE